MVGRVVELVIMLPELWRRGPQSGETLPHPEVVEQSKWKRLILCGLP